MPSTVSIVSKNVKLIYAQTWENNQRPTLAVGNRTPQAIGSACPSDVQNKAQLDHPTDPKSNSQISTETNTTTKDNPILILKTKIAMRTEKQQKQLEWTTDKPETKKSTERPLKTKEKEFLK